MKKLRSILIINSIGLIALFLPLFGYHGTVSSDDSRSHQSVVIDEEALKGKLELYSTEDLKMMLNAGGEIEKWMTMLESSGTNLVEKVLMGQGVFTNMKHYPLQDTFDKGTYSQYYYHAHRKGEHGHFHLFLRQGGIKEGTLPLLYDEKSASLNDANTFAHLVAISMDDEGYPLALFTTNQWVTGEDWYSAIDLKEMVKRFNIEHAHPSYVVNRWLKAMLILFQPQIEALIDERDERLVQYKGGIPLKVALEDQELDVITEEEISIKGQIRMIRKILKERGVG